MHNHIDVIRISRVERSWPDITTLVKLLVALSSKCSETIIKRAMKESQFDELFKHHEKIMMHPSGSILIRRGSFLTAQQHEAHLAAISEGIGRESLFARISPLDRPDGGSEIMGEHQESVWDDDGRRAATRADPQAVELHDVVIGKEGIP